MGRRALADLALAGVAPTVALRWDKLLPFELTFCGVCGFARMTKTLLELNLSRFRSRHAPCCMSC
jgi:hypothetical protein